MHTSKMMLEAWNKMRSVSMSIVTRNHLEVSFQKHTKHSKQHINDVDGDKARGAGCKHCKLRRLLNCMHVFIAKDVACDLSGQ